MVNNPVDGSRSRRSKPSASPRRIPVAKTSPIKVCIVAAASGEGSRPAAVIRAAMSVCEYRYGVARRVRAGGRFAGGTSVSGSMLCRHRAKQRTTPSRWAYQIEEPSGGRVAHCTASRVVTVSVSAASVKPTNCSSSRPAPTS